MSTTTCTPTLADAAVEHATKGLSIIPVGRDKRPLGEWKQRQTTPATPDEIRRATSNPSAVGFAVVCGKVSGGLEVLDFDVEGFYEAWSESVGELVMRLPVQRTGGGGYQVAYRCDKPLGNTKLAWSPSEEHEDGREVAIETRGEGGYAVVAPSLHPSGNRYKYLDDATFADAPHLTDAEVEFIRFTAGRLCKAPHGKREIQARAERERQARPIDRSNLNGQESVIDAWNKAMPIRTMLERCGYALDQRSGEYTRPGSDASPGGVVVFDDGRSFHHSTNDIMHDGKHSVDSFELFKVYEHGGNTSEAVKGAARELGVEPASKSDDAEVGSAWQRTSETLYGDCVLPPVALPEDATTIREAGRKLGKLLAANGYYTRGAAKAFATVTEREVQLIKPNRARSIFESVARLGVSKIDDKGGKVFKPKPCSKEAADGIIEADTFKAELPPINAVSHCPVLLPDGSVVAGYHPQNGLYAFGEPPEDIAFDDAKPLLLGLLEDFAFVTDNDHARAMAAMLTPAMVYGKLLGDTKRCPITCREADRSQAGKGIGNRADAALYGTLPQAVGQRTGGVGSMEESASKHLIAAAPFITFDNVRGKLNSPWLEMTVTEPLVDCRVPHRGSVSVDPSRTVFSITSNRAELTPDLANRCNIIRITKQPEGYKYKTYPEGDIIDHIRANQPRYLGAVYAVLRAWLEAGRPGEPDGRHDMRQWGGAVRWIVQDLLGLADPLAGHRELQLRTANASGNWLRDVCLAVAEAGKIGAELHTHELFDILHDAEVEVPGFKPGDDPENEACRGKAFRGIGLRLSKAFKKQDNPADPLPVDSFEIERISMPHPDVPGRLSYHHRFHKSTSPQVPIHLLKSGLSSMQKD